MSGSKGGNNRDWGYASYDVDRYDDYSDSNLQYTSYEKSGSVNRYGDNGDGGHSHAHYNDSSSYNTGGNPDSSRSSSNSSSNPSTGEVQSGGGCYLTSACMKHMQEKFDDNCHELQVLRWFRDNFVSKEDICKYYEIAPIIVSNIDQLKDNEKIYDYIYKNIVLACVNAIEIGNYEFAYNRYKNSVLALEEKYAKSTIVCKIKSLKIE